MAQAQQLVETTWPKRRYTVWIDDSGRTRHISVRFKRRGGVDVVEGVGETWREAITSVRRQRRGSGLGHLSQDAEQPPQSQPRRRTWLWVLLATAAGVGVFFVVRRIVRASKRPPGLVEQQSVPADAAAPAAARPEKVAVLGDSLTKGYLQYLRGLLPSVEVVGDGWVGKQIAVIAANGASYLDPSVTRVVLGGGVNDMASGHSAERAYADLLALVALVRSRAPQAYIYLITIPPCSSNAACKRVASELEKFDGLLRSTPGAYVIDMSGVGETGKDGLHRTGAGYSRMAQVVAQALQ